MFSVAIKESSCFLYLLSLLQTKLHRAPQCSWAGYKDLYHGQSLTPWQILRESDLSVSGPIYNMWQGLNPARPKRGLK